MKGKRRRFNRDFKIEAVNLVTKEGNSVVDVARDLRLHPNTLGLWKKQLSEDPAHAFPGKGHMKPEQQELADLRKKVKRLEQENEILKKQLGTLRRTSGEVRVYKGQRAESTGNRSVQDIRRICERILRMEGTSRKQKGDGESAIA